MGGSTAESRRSVFICQTGALEETGSFHDDATGPNTAVPIVYVYIRMDTV